MRYLSIFSCLFFVAPVFLFAQQKADTIFVEKGKMPERPVEIETVIYLTSGGQVRGRLVEWAQGDRILLVTRDSLRLVLPETAIVSIKQFRYGGPPVLKDKKRYEFREQGRYFATNLGMMPAPYNQQWGDSGLNMMETFTFSAVVGQQLSRIAGLGFGLGLDKYGENSDLTVMPVFVEFRSYFFRSRNTPYLNILFGRGFAQKLNDNSGFNNFDSQLVKGGIFLSPNFGIRFGAKERGNLIVDFGLRLQKGYFEGTSFGSTIKKDLFYRRYTLRVGMVF